MKEGWEKKKLGEVCEKISRGISPKYIEMNGVIVLNQKCIRDHKINYAPSRKHDDITKNVSDDKYIRIGDVLVNSTGEGTLGRVAQVRELPKERVTVDSHISIVRPLKNVFFLDFFGWAMIFIENEIAISGAGASGQTELARSILENNFTLVYPKSLPEQQRIVCILDEAFAAIAKAKANAEQNLKNAKELFESYLQDLFSKLFQNSEKRKVSELAKVTGGYSFKSTDFKREGKYQVIRMGNIRQGIIRENESPVFIDEIDDKTLSKALVLPNDVIITQTGTKNKRDYGFTVIIEKGGYLLNQRIASIRFDDKYLSEFFLYFSWTNIFKDQYFANESGTVGQGNVGISAITDAKVPFIKMEEQKVIVAKIEKLRIETQSIEAIYQQKISDLEELKKSVMQKAFLGELKTNTVEI